jgi:hypothetical protein
MTPKLRRSLDPLDLELIERALDGARVALEREGSVIDPDSDEALEAALRQELIEFACENDVSDPEILRERLLATLSE